MVLKMTYVSPTTDYGLKYLDLPDGLLKGLGGETDKNLGIATHQKCCDGKPYPVV